MSSDPERLSAPRASRPRSAPRRIAGLSPALIAIALICSLIELTLSAADARLIGSPLWRPLAYQYGAFWAGLLHNWSPNYAAQPWLMFLTYSFLHAGPGHLLGNLFTLAVLGPMVERRAGRPQMLAIYAAATLGGGAAFGLLAATPQPMVGASGALFGLAGAWQYHDIMTRRAPGARIWPALQALGGLAALNLALWALMAGRLAWETHLGGFLAGWAMAALLARRGRSGTS